MASRNSISHRIPLQIQWDLGFVSLAGGASAFLHTCEQAARAGVDSVLVQAPTRFAEVLLSIVDAANSAPGLKFALASDIQSILRELRGIDLFHASEDLPGRLALHVRFLPETSVAEFAAAEEFFAACLNGCPNLALHIEGHRARAAFLAIKLGQYYWKKPSQREQFYADVLPVLHFGKSIGLVSHVVARPSREMALADFAALLPRAYEGQIRWVTPNLCADSRDPYDSFAAIVGSYMEVAEIVHAYKSCGVSRFMTHPAGAEEEWEHFLGNVLPLIRNLECNREAS